MTPQTTYKKVLKILRYRYGNGVKTDDELTQIGVHHFGPVYIGTFAYDEYANMLKKLPAYGFAIVNTDTSNGPGVHWVAIHNHNNKYYIYDSFGRHTKNILNGLYKHIKRCNGTIIDSKYDAEQADYQKDCGIRCISWLLIIKCLGVKQASKI
jgi:hypothetical protein